MTLEVKHPGLVITKIADNTITKAGDTVHFTVTTNNTGDVDLVLDTFTDSLMGNIKSHFSGTLAAGTAESWGYDYVVPNPYLGGATLSNTATAHYHITGLPNDITDDSTVTLEVKHPLLVITKIADNTITKAGDTVHFTVTTNNTGDVDLVLDTFTDSLMGNIKSHFSGTLAAGTAESWGYDYVVPNPYLGGATLSNTATAHYHITGLPNDITDDDTVTLSLMHPGLVITKTADNTITKAGDTVHFTVTTNNTGDVDLVLDTFTDSLMGNIKSHFSGTLAAGTAESWGYDYVVPNPYLGGATLSNTATAHYHITGLPNDITASSTVTLSLMHPGLVITKTADNTITKAGDTVHFTVTTNNTGDVDLVLDTFTDSLMGNIKSHFSGTLAAGTWLRRRRRRIVGHLRHPPSCRRRVEPAARAHIDRNRAAHIVPPRVHRR